MKEYRPKPGFDPNKNSYVLGIAYRLGVDPHRIMCDVRISPSGGLLLDVQLDGRDLRGDEERLVGEYFQEEFHGLLPRIEG